jgi:hypothetical protein
MLPACRTEGDVFAIPQFTLDPRDVEGFMDELHGFHTAFHGCFARSEPRDHFFHYMVGQFSALARKSIEPMALQVEGGNVRAMQRCISDTVWAEAQTRGLVYGDVCSQTRQVCGAGGRRVSDQTPAPHSNVAGAP